VANLASRGLPPRCERNDPTPVRTARRERWSWAQSLPPGLAGDVTTGVAEELAKDLARSYGAVGWRTVLEVDRLVELPALTTDLIDAARRTLPERGWLELVGVDGNLEQLHRRTSA
jgi:hypothetical protein